MGRRDEHRGTPEWSNPAVRAVAEKTNESITIKECIVGLRRILVIAPTAIGDAVVFNPLLKTLRANAPDVTLTLLAPKSLQPLVRLFPGPDEFVSIDDVFYTEGGECGADAERVLSREYDLVLDMLCTQPCIRIMHRLSAQIKVGINFAPDEPSPYSLEIQPFSAVENRSAIDCYLDYARALQLPEIDESTAINPQRLDPIYDAAVAQLVETVQSETSIALLLAAGDWHKRYPPALVSELIRACCLEFTPVLLYGPSEADEYSAYLDEWRLARTGRIHIFTGSLSHAIHVLRACSGAVANDCGLMHIAVALGVPTLSLFGPSEPVAWFPYRHAETQRFMVAQALCRPCYGDERGLCGNNHCMSEFSAAKIWKEFSRLRLRRTAPTS
jgi:ADP-heptose:LPS heptosyltransferase